MIHSWQVVKNIVDPNDGNTNKYWMKTVPGFDENEFPFVVCNGWEAFNLINVKDFHMEPLVKASVKTGLS